MKCAYMPHWKRGRCRERRPPGWSHRAFEHWQVEHALQARTPSPLAHAQRPRHTRPRTQHTLISRGGAHSDGPPPVNGAHTRPGPCPRPRPAPVWHPVAPPPASSARTHKLSTTQPSDHHHPHWHGTCKGAMPWLSLSAFRALAASASRLARSRGDKSCVGGVQRRPVQSTGWGAG